MNDDLVAKVDNNVINLAIICNTIFLATDEEVADEIASKLRESINLIRELTAIISELEADK